MSASLQIQDAQTEAARSFVGLAGAWEPGSLSLPNCGVQVLEPGEHGRCRDSVLGCRNRVWQVLASTTQLDGNAAAHDQNTVVCWAGTVWEIAGAAHGDDVLHRLRRHLVDCTDSDPPRSMRAVEGQVAAAVVRPGRVVLLRKAGSGYHLFYRVRGTALYWSTNFIDLVENPLEEIDRDLLAHLATGAPTKLPFPSVGILRAGEYLSFNGSVTQKGVFDPIEQQPPERKLSLDGWSELTRDVLMQGARRRARAFGKIGVLLSGGIDSSVIARCLVDVGADVTLDNGATPSYPPSDESAYARRTAEMLGAPLRVIRVDEQGRGGAGFIDER